MPYTVAPFSKAVKDLVIYDWLVMDEVAYRVNKIEVSKASPFDLIRVRLSNGSVYQFSDDELITVLQPKNS